MRSSIYRHSGCRNYPAETLCYNEACSPRPGHTLLLPSHGSIAGKPITFIMRDVIPVIDLFAGPGGLGEGFSSFLSSQGLRQFRIGLSVEMEAFAHQTLTLRSFYRQFPTRDRVPDAYYQYLQGRISLEQLARHCPSEMAAARHEALRAELGTTQNGHIYNRINQALSSGRRRRNAPWVLIGGPPCQAYSTMGRSKLRNLLGENFEKDSRHRLYREYLKILVRFRPSVFVMENVKGMLSASLDGQPVFQRVISDLRDPFQAVPESHQRAGGRRVRYRVFSLTNRREDMDPEHYLIEAERFGIPQMRHRVILVGVREDIGLSPRLLAPHAAPVTARQVLQDLPAIRSQLSKHALNPPDSPEAWPERVRAALQSSWFQQLRIGGGKSDLTLDLTGASELVEALEQAASDCSAHVNPGAEFMPGEVRPQYRPDWFADPRLGGVCNHTARAHMAEDLQRYLFIACYGKIHGYSPKLRHLPDGLLPDHKNVRADVFNDRFRVQVADLPATTIAAHISKDGHYNIHYDPSQCRSLTVREAARLQTFPDDYFFEGPRTAQYRQVGNAVPPLLAWQIAGVVHELLERTHGAD